MFSDELLNAFNCSLCLEIYRDPVMLRCGHSFCKRCIETLLAIQERSGVYVCPECKEEFQERPAMQRNLSLCRIVSPRPQKIIESGAVCTHCANDVKNCLQCFVHLDGCSKQQVLSEPTACNEKGSCTKHSRPLYYYCCEDDAFCCGICCDTVQHLGHRMEPLNETWEKRKTILKNNQVKMTSEIEVSEKRVQNLQRTRQEVQTKSATETNRVIVLFNEIMEQVKIRQQQILGEISRHREQIVQRISDQIQHLEIKKDELSRRIHQNDLLCNVTDPVVALEQFQLQNTDFCEVLEGDKMDFAEEVLDERLISLTLNKALSDIVTYIKEKKLFYVHGASDILLDVNKVRKYVVVSGDLKIVSSAQLSKRLPKMLNHFLPYSQILSSISFLSGQHYWEVETSTSGNWSIGMSYPGLGKNGGQYRIGSNKKSWCLLMQGNDYAVLHDSIVIPLITDSSCQRFGIFLDYEAGRLSFYQLCDPIRHLHTFTASFTEPLHAAFYVYDKAWVRLTS
ncbi:E3 ubiquitin-protein ligase TRIM58-like [Discoglossus pictus]